MLGRTLQWSVVRLRRAAEGVDLVRVVPKPTCTSLLTSFSGGLVSNKRCASLTRWKDRLARLYLVTLQLVGCKNAAEKLGIAGE